MLDLCSGPGTFRIPRQFRLLVSMDAELPTPRAPGAFVLADAHAVPLADASVHLVIAAHCLEHVERPDAVLAEVGRVLRADGMLYLSVPRWDSLTDRLYRFVYPRAGGHITPWRSAEQVQQAVESATGLRLLGKRPLFSSMRFLIDGRLPRRRRWLLWWANAWTVSGLLWVLWRLAGDRWLDYGWEFYFGQSQPPPDLEAERDVCCGCGAGHSASWLEHGGHVRRGRGGLAFFRCPDCRQWNFRRSA